MADPDVIIIGAGVSGLAAAIHLERAGYSCLILERSDDVGGRIRTDAVDGFLLDRGFQILLTAYPEARELLDHDALNLRAFVPGALSWNGAAFDRLSDPRRDRRLSHLTATALSGAASLPDKLRAARMVLPLLRGNPSDLLPADIADEALPGVTSVPDARGGTVTQTSRPAPPAPVGADPRRQTTLEYLTGRGFSDRAVRRFWKPFLSGVFLEPDLETAAGFAQYTLRMFATGEAALPARGIQAIPRQLASKLTRSRIELGAEVVEVSAGAVALRDGRRISLAKRVVLLATEDRTARQLLQLPPGQTPEKKSTACLYFATDQPPLREPILLLDGTGAGPINTVVVPSLVQRSYAPAGKHLVSLSTVGLPVIDDQALREQAVGQMAQWFGPEVRGWRHLRTYRVPDALPDASPGAKPRWQASPWIGPGLYRAGDALDSPSLQGALASARRAASAGVLELRK